MATKHNRTQSHSGAGQNSVWLCNVCILPILLWRKHIETCVVVKHSIIAASAPSHEPMSRKHDRSLEIQNTPPENSFFFFSFFGVGGGGGWEKGERDLELSHLQVNQCDLTKGILRSECSYLKIRHGSQTNSALSCCYIGVVAQSCNSGHACYCLSLLSQRSTKRHLKACWCVFSSSFFARTCKCYVRCSTVDWWLTMN